MRIKDAAAWAIPAIALGIYGAIAAVRDTAAVLAECRAKEARRARILSADVDIVTDSHTGLRVLLHDANVEGLGGEQFIYIQPGMMVSYTNAIVRGIQAYHKETTP